MLFVALSCLQGCPMGSALGELGSLADGVQLTPGNHPTRGFAAAAARLPTRTHHGFAFDRRRSDVWSDDGQCLVASDSVHPPAAEEPAAAGWLEWIAVTETRPVIETMYPGYELGTGAAIARAIDLGLPLAVDVSHVFIQRAAGVIDERTWARLRDYAGVREVHVSANDGRSDRHAPLVDDSFGLDWARERLRGGTPVVLECYMHRLTDDDRRRQIDLVREGRRA